MVTKAKKDQQKDLAKIKSQAREAKINAKIHRAKQAAKVAKKTETKDRRSQNIRGSKGVLVSSADVKDPELRAELQATAGGLTPPHRHDIHLKKETITVTVTLHNVPPQKIVVDQTTDKVLMVSTPAHNKKFHLEFPFPLGMTVDASKGDYTFESGELICVFPVTKMPADIVRDWTERLESVRKSQRARFDIDKEGDLIVRKRKTKMEFEQLKTDAIAKKAAKVAKAAAGTEGKAAPAGKKAAATPAAAAATAASAKKDAKSAKVAKAPVKAPIGKGGASAKPAPGASDDKAAMLKIAQQAAHHVSQSLKARMNVAKEALARRQQRAAVVSAKKEVKADKMQNAFTRVLDAKRAELARRAERVSDAPSPSAKARVSAGKSVHFAGSKK